MQEMAWIVNFLSISQIICWWISHWISINKLFNDLSHLPLLPDSYYAKISCEYSQNSWTYVIKTFFQTFFNNCFVIDAKFSSIICLLFMPFSFLMLSVDKDLSVLLVSKEFVGYQNARCITKHSKLSKFYWVTAKQADKNIMTCNTYWVLLTSVDKEKSSLASIAWLFI